MRRAGALARVPPPQRGHPSDPLVFRRSAAQFNRISRPANELHGAPQRLPPARVRTLTVILHQDGKARHVQRGLAVLDGTAPTRAVR